ncbi:hypothetical protein KJ780_02225 [Candidatus Micrarchaeota archaeon]|nr:hypothetical protein [Candidatus Micrarchaeota archaeon]
MAFYKIKKFGSGGLHIVLKKSDGFREGDVVNIVSKHQTETELEKMVKKLLEKYGPDIVRREIEEMQQNKGF